MAMACPAWVSNDDIIVGKANDALQLSWTLLLIYCLVFMLSAWIVVSNSLKIYNKIMEWRNNVRAEVNKQSQYIFQDLTDPSLDNEVYSGNDVNADLYMRDNSYIRKRLDEVKTQHATYNRALTNAKKFEDVVDEKLLDAVYDNYAKPKKASSS